MKGIMTETKLRMGLCSLPSSNNLNVLTCHERTVWDLYHRDIAYVPGVNMTFRRFTFPRVFSFTNEITLLINLYNL
jgi:hypothetical protein